MNKTQEEYLKEILELKAQHPEMDIHFCVDSDELCDSGWTAHRITGVEINPWWFDGGERIETDEDNIRDEMENLIFIEEGMTDEECKKAVDEQYQKEVKEAFCVYTHAG